MMDRRTEDAVKHLMVAISRLANEEIARAILGVIVAAHDDGVTEGMMRQVDKQQNESSVLHAVQDMLPMLTEKES